MANPKARRSVKKPIVIKMRKAHRVLVLAMFGLLFLCMLVAMIYVMTSTGFHMGIVMILFAIPTFLFLPFPLYYATWKIKFDANGIQKHFLGKNGKKYPWSQVKEVRSAWLISERSNGISIIFRDGKAIHFRMDCENAEAAKKLILLHCSITEHRGMI